MSNDPEHRYYNPNVEVGSPVISSTIWEEGIKKQPVAESHYEILEVNDKVVMKREEDGEVISMGIDIFMEDGIFGGERFTVVTREQLQEAPRLLGVFNSILSSSHEPFSGEGPSFWPQ